MPDYVVLAQGNQLWQRFLTDRDQSCQPGASEEEETWIWICPSRCCPEPCADVCGEREIGVGTMVAPGGTGTACRHGQLPRARRCDCPMAESLVAGTELTWLLHALGRSSYHLPLSTSGLQIRPPELGAAEHHHPLSVQPLVIAWLNETLQYNFIFLKNLLAPSALLAWWGRRNSNTRLISSAIQWIGQLRCSSCCLCSLQRATVQLL